MFHLKKFTLLLWCSCYFMELQAMDLEQEKKPLCQSPPTPQRPINIVSPEAVKLNQELQCIGFLCPKVAQLTPQIDSAEEFAVAKKYFSLSKQFDVILYGAAIAGSHSELLDISQQTLTNLESYLTVLQGESCRKFRSSEDQEELSTHSYDLKHRMGRNHLFLLIVKTLRPTSLKDLGDVKQHVKEIENIKALLLGSANYHQKLQRLLQQAQEDLPVIKHYFQPSQKQQPVKYSQKIENQRELKRRQKLINRTTDAPSEGLKESFGLYAHLTVQKILTENWSLSLKKNSSDEYVRNIQKLMEEQLSFEKDLQQFKIERLGLKEPDHSKELESQSLTELYRFFVQQATVNHYKFHPLDLLQQSILICIDGNQIEEALKRVEILRTLLLERGPLPDYFASFHASIKSLNGDSDDWRKLIEEKRKFIEKEKTEEHQQDIDRIKKKLEQNQKKEEEKPVEKSCPRPIRKETEEVRPFDDNVSYRQSSKEPKFEIPIPREKIKTRKSTQPSTSSPQVEKGSTSEEATTFSKQARKDYCVSKNAFKTYNKIRNGDSKFERKDLYNLFDKLGCTVDISQGKGDHSRIFLPLNMAISNEDGLVAVIPEFVQKELPLPESLTVPNWDEKWDGRVPPYMMKSILQALDYLGATDDTVHK